MDISADRSAAADPHVDLLGVLNHFDNFKRDVLAVQALEQSRAPAEEHGDEVNCWGTFAPIM